MFALLSLCVSAQAADIDLQIRPRAEVRKVSEDSDPVAWVSQRARAGLGISNGTVGVGLSVQDVRFWGEELNTLKDYTADGFDLHTGYLDWTPADAFSLRVGRQEIAIHEHRLIGTVGWTQQGRSLDAAKASLKSGAVSADVAGAIVTDSDTAGWDDDATLALLRAGWAQKGTRVDVLAIRDTNTSGDLDRITAGLYVKGGAGMVSARAEGYAQITEGGTANMFGVQGTLAPEASIKPKLTLWFDQLSATDGETPAFNTLMATNHKFYGHADVAAFSLGGAADGRGLQDAALKVGLSPMDGTSLGVDAHRFATTDGSGDAIGMELDLVVKQKLSKGLGLGLGGAMFMPDEGDTQYWGWLQLDAKLGWDSNKEG